MAGLEGIKNKIDPGEPVKDNIYTMPEDERIRQNIGSLPGSLSDALYELEHDEVIAKALGPHVFNDFIKLEQAEWNLYKKQVHDWEIQRYINIM